MRKFIVAALLTLSLPAAAENGDRGPETFLPAIAPVRAAELESALRRDMRESLSTGFLAPGKPIGVSIAVIRDGESSLFALGAARPHSLFEIGSLTKAFTGLLMAQMVEQELVKTGTAVRELLPAGTVAKPPGKEITLLDLVTQQAGLPVLPDNLSAADYPAAKLYELIGKHGVARPEPPIFLDSNVGFGLLGQALANRTRIEYRKLSRIKVLEPLGMRDTGVQVPDEQRHRLMLPYNASLQLENSWDVPALAGALVLRSSAADIGKYLRAQFEPDRLAGLNLDSRTLPAALKRASERLAEAQPGRHVAYAWIYDDATGTYLLNGATAGFSSAMFFDPRKRFAGVVLTNLGSDGQAHLAGALSEHIQQRLAGKEARSLEAW